MKKLKHYVYVYLDPRKPGQYEYFENGIGISFDFEPFYIGKGKNKRMYKHLKEAIKNKRHPKIQKIRKIWSLGLEPIIYKIFEFENEQDALNVERVLGFLIGRLDQKRGPLTNQTDCGGKTTNKSTYVIEKQILSLHITLENNPEIKIKQISSLKETLKNNPEITINQQIKRKKTLENNPQINIDRNNKRNQTLKDNPNIMKDASKKSEQTKKDNPEIELKRIKSYQQTLKNNPQISENKRRIMKEKRATETDFQKKQREDKKILDKQQNPIKYINSAILGGITRKKNKSMLGENNARYVKLNYCVLIEDYFNLVPRLIMIENYKKNIEKISNAAFSKFYKILNFPVNSLDKCKPYKREIYLKFVEENKDKIQWYIDNYERLEEEYFENKNS